MEWLPQDVSAHLGLEQPPTLHRGSPRERFMHKDGGRHPDASYKCEELGAATLLGLSSHDSFLTG